MGIKVNLDKAKEKLFREKAMKKFGYKKGALSSALEEAIDLWLSKENEELETVDNPTIFLRGLLKDVKETSVELQHAASRLFIND